jgi:hypothetical protein
MWRLFKSARLAIPVFLLSLSHYTPQNAQAPAATGANPPQSITVPSDTELEIRAAAVRQSVVERFGSKAQQFSFHHPLSDNHAPRPKFKGDPTPSQLQQMNDFVAKSQQPFQIFDAVFNETMRKLLGIPAVILPTRKADAVSFWEKLAANTTTMLPTDYGSKLGTTIVMRNATAMDAANTQKVQLATRSLILNSDSKNELLISHVLSATDVKAYVDGNVDLKLLKVCEAARAAVVSHPVPTAYVLALSDPDQYVDAFDSGTRKRLSTLAPEDEHFRRNIWPTLSMTERWKAVTYAQLQFAENCVRALSADDPLQAEVFLSKMPDPASLASSQSNGIDMGDGLTLQVLSGSPSEAMKVSQVNTAMHFASEILAYTEIVDLATPSDFPDALQR